MGTIIRLLTRLFRRRRVPLCLTGMQVIYRLRETSLLMIHDQPHDWPLAFQLVLVGPVGHDDTVISIDAQQLGTLRDWLNDAIRDVETRAVCCN